MIGQVGTKVWSGPDVNRQTDRSIPYTPKTSFAGGGGGGGGVYRYTGSRYKLILLHSHYDLDLGEMTVNRNYDTFLCHPNKF